MQIGDRVMVRDLFIEFDYMVPPAKIVEIKRDPVLFRKIYLLEFEGNKQKWFDEWAIKKE